MKIIVTGLECSGTQWMTSLLAKYPGVEAVHTSVPQEWMPDSRYPDLSGGDRVVWMIRYEPIRLMSLARAGYAQGRPEDMLPPAVYQWCLDAMEATKPIFVGYETLIGPLGFQVFRMLLASLGLDANAYQAEWFNPIDGNQKWMSLEEWQAESIGNGI